MSEENEHAGITLYPEWKQAAIDAVSEFTYGDTISHDWLYTHFDMKPPEHGRAADFQKFQFQFLSYVESFKDYMLEKNKMLLVSSRGVGYLIVEPEAQTVITWDMMTNKMRKELTRAQARLTNILIDALSDEAKRDNANKQATLAALRAMHARMIESADEPGDE